jgi:uncharacterized protein YbjT (DUF2867 family)
MPEAARTALLAGATGLVGSHCLGQLLGDSRFGRVVALVRRPLPLRDPKLEAVIVDFDRLAEADLPRADDAFCALGTTIRRAGTREAFRRVDHDYIVDFARRAAATGVEQFVLVSALGANPRSLVFYNRVKGETERDVAALGFRAVHFLRPSFLVGERSDHRSLEHAAIAVFTALAPLMVGPVRKYRPIAAQAVARAMRAVARDASPGKHIHESDQIATLGTA